MVRFVAVPAGAASREELEQALAPVIVHPIADLPLTGRRADGGR
jgi:hypothetical protein